MIEPNNAKILCVLKLVSQSFEDIALGRGGWAWEEILDEVNRAIEEAEAQ